MCATGRSGPDYTSTNIQSIYGMSQPAKNSRMSGPSFGRQKTGGYHQKNYTSTNLPSANMNTSISSTGGGLKK